MANEQNLKPIRKGELSKEEAKKRGSAGGKKSVEVRRAKKTMKEMLDYLLEKELPNKKGEMVTYREAMLTAMVKKAIEGDVKASVFVRDTVGEAPVTKTEVTGKGGSPLVQKVFVSEKDKKEINKQIDELINGK